MLYSWIIPSNKLRFPLCLYGRGFLLKIYFLLFMYLPETPFIWHLSSRIYYATESYVSIYKWSSGVLYSVRFIYASNRELAFCDCLKFIDTSNIEGCMVAQEFRVRLTELKDFCQQLDNLLVIDYDPKLDDSVGKNIAPLQKRKKSATKCSMLDS